ncbi:copper resistance protein CopC [Actinoplanes sp. DH11]|uniref:copper resistance protein CopC n=1 Tax=Actinoplanes sp. DH11 TaxID=2857011 RepID=UPI001E64A76D|nr:copper resistance protein CopC [Actinoplanes sp. DH11]
MDDIRLRRPRPARSGPVRPGPGRSGPARLLVAVAALLAVLLPGVPAWAHNALTDAKPAKNAELAKAPASVTLKFLQKLDPAKTVITVSDADQRQVATSAPEVDGGTGVVEFDEPLGNGVFTVAYQVASTDGHTVKGSYKFTVEDPAAAAPASSPSSLSSSSSSSSSSEAVASSVASGAAPAAVDAAPVSDSSSSALGWLAGVAVLVFAALAGFVIVRRRRRPAS